METKIHPSKLIPRECNKYNREPDSCVMTHKYTNAETGVRGFFCVIHQLWAYQFPMKRDYIYAENP
jgi:hypothetical protein